MTGASKWTTLEMENWQKIYHHWVKAVKKWRPWKIESPSMCRRAETCTLLLTPCQGYTWVSQISPVMCVCVCPLSSFEFCKATPSTPFTLRIINSATMWDVTFYEDSLKTIPQSQATKGTISKTIRWTISISGRMIKPTNAGEIRIYADRRAQVWRECQLPHLWPSLSHKKKGSVSWPMKHWSHPLGQKKNLDVPFLTQNIRGCPAKNALLVDKCSSIADKSTAPRLEAKSWTRQNRQFWPS